ncbi:MAG: tRNA (adenosine(37)-N6)-threonylcarbamoyltransferase complex ATPase subunit type 1 TsaE [Deinococcota bacterium]|nr:tRNA (adenosine(37)-N6)-threonylcarbamoyltransferase complex ATPase subunit type 1 TsaE [Deinococcota bacterium]
MKLLSLSDTRTLAAQVVNACPPGSLLILFGELGTGKTTLTQLIGLELGSTAHISSPSYTLIHEYPTPEGLLVHIDAYRLPSGEALLDLGLEDYLARSRLVVVEWGEGLLEHYPEACSITLTLCAEGRQAEVKLGTTR